MKINKQFNTLTYLELVHLIEQHQRFTDFNTLGLFRAIIESTKLTIEQKIQIRDIALVPFHKTFDFLQLKDPVTYFEVATLGQHLTEGDRQRLWENIRHNQQKILKRKKIRHRNFGTYSKHLCGYDTCPLNGLMIKQDSSLSYPLPHSRTMPFPSDIDRYQQKINAIQKRQNRKQARQIINQQLYSEL